jgi:4-diphosphocytidyl-2-C-methyl-D-erythritol kinase
MKPKNLSFSTKQIYTDYAPYIEKEKDTSALDYFYENPCIDTIKDLKNDLEKSVPDKQFIQELKGLLSNHGAFYSSMTGSGSAVFGLFEKKPELLHHERCQTYSACFVS